MKRNFSILLIRLGALFSFCGGPLWLSDWLQPLVGEDPAFGITFAPIAVIVYSSLSLLDGETDRLSRMIRRMGQGCAGLVLLTNFLAALSLCIGPARPDRVLIGFSCVVGSWAMLAYLAKSRRHPE